MHFVLGPLWVRSAILKSSRSLPVYPDKRTIFGPVRTSHSGQFLTHAPQQTVLLTLFDHLVGACEESLRNSKPEGIGSLTIDDKIKLGGLLDWNVGWLRTAQNLVNHFGGAAVHTGNVRSIGDQSSGFHVVLGPMHRRQSRAQRQGVDPNSIGVYERVGHNIKCIRTAFKRL
jgi:hypothetical protein